MPHPVTHDTIAVIDGRRTIFGSVEEYARICWFQGTCNLPCYEGWSWNDYKTQVLELNIKNGGTARWINLVGAALVNDVSFRNVDYERWSKALHLKSGDLIQFVGDEEVYRIDPTHNRNFKLTEVLPCIM